MVRHRPRCRHTHDRAATHRVRPYRARRPTEDCRQPPHTIALDRATIRLLRKYRRRQQAERDAAGDQWQDSGYVFTTLDGSPRHPDWLTRRFRRLVALSGLPPVRLHDLRHGAASLALAAGADLKNVQSMLGRQQPVLPACLPRSIPWSA